MERLRTSKLWEYWNNEFAYTGTYSHLLKRASKREKRNKKLKGIAEDQGRIKEKVI